jgi:hypothetical protein
MTPATIFTALKALVLKKAQGPSSPNIRHIQKANSNTTLADLFYNVLKKSQAFLKWSNLLIIFIPKGDAGYNRSITKLPTQPFSNLSKNSS